MLFSSPVVCTMHGILWNIAPRMSVFLIAVLSISRTISLLFPFRRIKRQHVLTPVVLYMIIQVVQSTLPYWFGAVYKYKKIIIGEWQEPGNTGL